MTFFYKRVFPVIWFGFLALFIAVPFFSFSNAGHSAMPPLEFYFVLKKLVFDLVDEVWDDGASLLIRNRGDEARVNLSDIKNVSYSPFINPPRVTLSLRTPTVFGDEITFNAPTRFMPFSPSSIIKELINRIDLARRRTN